jgi:hypothetical protein
MAREVELDELLEQMPRIAKKFKAFEALVRADERERILDMCKEGLWDAEGIRLHLNKQEQA